ncbi:MAG: transposase family protein [Terriglobia bacterium]|nr:transposase family protein [Terriglobia bacterium]
MRRKRGNKHLVCSGCGRLVSAIAVSYEREVRDLPWSEYRATVVVELYRVAGGPPIPFFLSQPPTGVPVEGVRPSGRHGWETTNLIQPSPKNSSAQFADNFP